MKRLLSAVLALLPGHRRSDALLDRLGSAAPGEPQTPLDELAAAWIKDVEANAVNDIDTDTALAAINQGRAA